MHAATPAPRTPSRLLVVDDDPTMRAILTRILEKAGWRVLEAGTGGAARAMLAREPVDAIILDQSLPDTTGTALAAELTDAFGNDRPPCVLVTGSPESVAPEARALFEAMLPKPFSLPELTTLVERLTGRAPAE